MTPHALTRSLVPPLVALGLIAAPALAQPDWEDRHRDGLAAIVEQWLDAGHGDYDSPSFTYWNKDGAVPEDCAACHSQPGFLDYLGTDGSDFGVVDAPAAINAPIGCASCHSEAAHDLDEVTFPSGETLTGLGPDATCAVCHQGRHSGDDVAAATEGLDADTVSSDLGFLNIHYGIASAVMGGADLRGGYHYPDQNYAGTFEHVPSADTCADCHDPHSTQLVDSEGCMSCHRGVEDLRDIRMQHDDFDGDGNVAGGIHAEITGLQTQLDAAIRAYADEVIGTPIGYAPGSFPYFFTDSNDNGVIDEDEAAFPNRYQNWTPRLLKAAYNYQAVKKDPGGYVHNPRYLLQLLHDSLADLGTVVALDLGGRPRP
ncbi:MAG: Formate-dependent nitrite reductase, periplasmic cytochrome c552 subunit [Rhodobacteraceae bacterium HLUCCO07]|nr:MAG: Formate-dependent nitrite reductase, periplasmic cytochrome c552 subunit [Rhodobacteraceae bacterium HLUCCO07]